MGYYRAGFDVIGVDIKLQKNYPFPFIQADAFEVFNDDFWILGGISDFAAIHASPPCPRYSRITHVKGSPEDHPDLVEPIRNALIATGLPYIIENVVGAPLLGPTQLCGSSLGLGASCVDGTWRQLRRHRLFETNFDLFTAPCSHSGEPVGVYGHGGGSAKTVWQGGKVRGYMATKEEAAEAMDIDWMNKAEMSDAIPPAYTEVIGEQLLAFLGS